MRIEEAKLAELCVLCVFVLFLNVILSHYCGSTVALESEETLSTLTIHCKSPSIETSICNVELQHPLIRLNPPQRMQKWHYKSPKRKIITLFLKCTFEKHFFHKYMVSLFILTVAHLSFRTKFIVSLHLSFCRCKF